MKSVSILAVIAALSSTALTANVVSIDIQRNPASSLLSRRHPSKRDTITESLINNITGGSYMASVKVGTPAQTVLLAIDTGSSDVWLLSSTADLCTDAEEAAYYGSCETTFDASKSSTFKVVDEDGFDISYADNSGATGDYITDDLTIGGTTVKTLEMGIAYNSTIPTGLLGIGYDVNEASESVYPNIIDDMLSQGLIATKAYSLYLNDLQSSTGSIIFGGLDSDKYHGDLLEIPVTAEHYRNGTSVYAEFFIALTMFSISSDTGTTTDLSSDFDAEPVLLDSGTTITYLPDLLVEDIYSVINAVDDTSNSGNVYVDCNLRTENASLTFNYGFENSTEATIKIPVSELVFDLTGLFELYPGTELPDLPFSSKNACGFGIQSNGGSTSILGDTFLRSAYVVYDLGNNQIAIAQTNFNSTSSNIVEFEASQTSIPKVSGVASGVSVTATASGNAGAGGGGKVTVTAQSGSASSTATATASSSTSSSAAVGTTPSLELSSLMIYGISAAFAIAGGSWFLA